MYHWFERRQVPLIGLDLGSHGVKLLELSKGGGRRNHQWEVASFASNKVERVMADARNQQGMSLTELLLGVAVVGILAAIAVPAMMTVGESGRLKGASEGLYQALQSARVEAIKQQANIYVVFQTGTSWCYGVNATTTCDCSVVNSCTLGRGTAAEFSSTSLATTGFSGANTFFDNVRGKASDSGNFTFTAGSKTVQVQLSQMGRVKICSSDVGGYQSC